MRTRIVTQGGRLSENFVAELDFENMPYIGPSIIKELESLLDQLEKNGIVKGSIFLKFYNENRQIDIAVLAFISLKSHNARWRNIEFLLNIENLQSEPILFKLRQYVAFSQFFSGNIPLVLFNRRKLIFTKQDKYTSFVVSQEFFPCFLIDASDQTTFNELFTEQISSDDVSRLFNKKLPHDAAMQELSETNKINVARYALAFLSLAISQLSNAIRSKLDENYSGKKYTERLQEKLQEQNYYAVLIFSILLLHSPIVFNIKSKSSDIYSYFIYLLTMANAQSTGIKEIAINILQHSTSKRGIITGRFYKGKDLAGIHELESDFNNYYQSFSEVYGATKDRYFFELCVIDESNKGILDTVRQPAANLSEVFNLYHGDNPDNPSQYIKVFAKIGLISFKQSILGLNGFFRVNSLHKRQPVTLSQFAGFEEIPQLANYSGGTYYSIIVPQIIEQKQTDSFVQIPQKIEATGFEDLLSYRFHASYAEASISYNATDKIVLECVLPIHDPGWEHKYEYESQSVQAILRKLFEFQAHYKSQTVIPLLNLKGSPCASNLGYFVRTIAGVLHDCSIRHFIVTNAQKTVVENFIELLRNQSLFWEPEASLLIYFESNVLSEKRINTPVLITGLTYNDFININRVYLDLDLDLNEEQASCITNSIFVYPSTRKMIEYDTIIETEGFTFFEWSAQYNLNKIITQDDIS